MVNCLKEGLFQRRGCLQTGEKNRLSLNCYQGARGISQRLLINCTSCYFLSLGNIQPFPSFTCILLPSTQAALTVQTVFVPARANTFPHILCHATFCNFYYSYCKYLGTGFTTRGCISSVKPGTAVQTLYTKR